MALGAMVPDVMTIPRLAMAASIPAISLSTTVELSGALSFPCVACTQSVHWKVSESVLHAARSQLHHDAKDLGHLD